MNFSKKGKLTQKNVAQDRLTKKLQFHGQSSGKQKKNIRFKSQTIPSSSKYCTLQR